jgi:phosphatidate cytidylyltransferase
MGRHSSADDADDELSAEDLARAEAELVAAGSVTETGRHYLGDLAGVPLADDRSELVGAPTDAPTDSDGSAAAPKTSRAGRNLPAAIGVGVTLAGAVVVTLLAYRPSFVAVVCLAVVIGVWEMVRAIGTVEARPPLVPLVVGGLAMDIAAWFQGPNGLVIGLLLTVLGLAVWRLGDGAVGYQRDVAAATFVALYVPLLAGFAILMAHYDDGAGRVIAFIGTVVCSDVGGYAAGVLIGRHPMAPTVSPKKSWEGFVGSVLACGACGGLLMTLTFHQQWWQGVLFGAAIAVTATLGDLGESMIKRDLGIKDMGRLLPGHGGLMDRLDSLLPCAVVAYLIFAAALPG